MPLQATSGAASYDAFGGGVPVVPNYIEECFSCFLYTGNGSTQTITNGIDLAGKGGLVWLKRRNDTAQHMFWDTNRGAIKYLASNTTNAEIDFNSGSPSVSYNSTGFGLVTTGFALNASDGTYASWTFRKQPKFFDVVTYTGNSSSGRTLSHSLESQPGFILIKRTDGADPWLAFARLNGTDYSSLRLNTTAAGSSYTQSDIASSTVINVGYINNNIYSCNISGETYVAYLFAHNAGGFGLTGTDNVVSCGSYTGNGSATGPVINLGYEPQWVMIKSSSAGSTENWYVFDSMRGMVNGSGNDQYLIPNLANAEAGTILISPTATGFTLEDGNTPVNRTSTTYVYVAIRRGPMKVPTVGTSVFEPSLYTGNGSTSRTFTTSTVAPIDMSINLGRTGTGGVWTVDRLRGNGVIRTWSTNAEVSSNTSLKFDVQNGYSNTGTAVNYDWNTNTLTNVQYFMKRAPSFFDEVCYSGNSTAGRTVTHNLGVVPQLIILKARTIDVDWSVYAEPAGNTKQAPLNDTGRFSAGINCWNNTSPTASVFSLSSNAQVNRTGDTYVAYLFSTCAGVSKVGSYTGIGSLQTIDCGFTSGARFVLIKNQEVSGSWYVWDSARGITSGNDPYLLLNSTAAEVTNTNYVDTDSTGFKVTGNTAVNTSGDTYIFLAIA